MKKRVVLLAIVAMFFVSVSSAWAVEDLVETVATGCEKELTTYCKDVTPGEGRILACLYAHSDKLTGRNNGLSPAGDLDRHLHQRHAKGILRPGGVGERHGGGIQVIDAHGQRIEADRENEGHHQGEDLCL